MKSALRFRFALAWEELRVPAALLLVGLLLAGTYVPALAHAEAIAVLAATPPLCAWLAARSLWHETATVRHASRVAALAAGSATLLSLWGPAPWDYALAVLLWASAPFAALVQLAAARAGARSFFAALIGIVIALGLAAPHDVHATPSAVLGAMLVALGAGGGGGLIVIAIADRFAPPTPN